MGDEPIFGHLTSATRLEARTSFPRTACESCGRSRRLQLSLVATSIRANGPEVFSRAIVRLAAALELFDVGRPPRDFAGIVAANVFHRAFALGPAWPALYGARLSSTLRVNGEPRECAAAPAEFADRVGAVARQDRGLTGVAASVPPTSGCAGATDLLRRPARRLSQPCLPRSRRARSACRRSPGRS